MSARGPEPARSLARWVEPPIGRGGLDAQWAAIRERREERRGRSARAAIAWLAGGAALAAAAALVFVLTRGEAAPAAAPSAMVATVSPAPGAVIESGAAPIDVRLAEGSEIALDPSTVLEATEAPAEDVRFALRRGRATFEVARRPTRRFVVTAGDVEVVVVGTRFSVAYEAGRVAVRVERGRVDVDTGRAVHQLGAGETWSGDATVAHEEVATDAPSTDAPERGRARRDVPSAEELFDQARTARREGRDGEAAQAYEQLIRRHPRDGHAGIAAFELARIRMDSLGDPRGAIDPLERAIAARAFREDAMARLVRAYDEAGQTARCRTARERYLAAYPEGVHRPQVEASCP